MQGRDTFNQGPGHRAFDQAFSSSGGGVKDPFSEAISGGDGAFGRPSKRGGHNSFNRNSGRGGSAFDQAFGHSTNEYNQTSNNSPFNASNGNSVFASSATRGNNTFHRGRGRGRGANRGGSTFNTNNNNSRGASFNTGRVNSAFDQAFGDNTQNDSNQAAFGQPTPTAFGQPSFNSNSSPFAQSTNNAFNAPQPTFGQPANNAFNSVQPTFGQPQNNTAFNQAFGNQVDQAASSNVFNQQPTNQAFNQAFGSPVATNAFNQQPKNQAFIQAFGNTAFDSSSATLSPFNQPAFNQAFGSAETPSPKAFNQAFGNNDKPSNNAFNQAVGGIDTPSPSVFKSSAFSKSTPTTIKNSNQPMDPSPSAFAAKPKPKAFGQKVAGVSTPFDKPNKTVDSSSINQQPKRVNSRGGGNVATRGGKGATTTATLAKRGGKTTTPFSRTLKTMEAPKEAGTTTAADRAARFGSTSKSLLYDQFKENRVRERQQAIKQGLIPDPDNPTRLEDAIDFRGTCQVKCPDFEMLEREIQNGLDSLEMDEDGNVDPEKAVKAYRRSAAGIDQPLPSDVRSPEALVKTLDYLVDNILSHVPLEKCHAFVRDRTRSIRQDFTLQNIRDITAVQLHERIARFHILCIHEMCELDENRFSKQQETEQLRKVLVSLMEFYDDLREEGIETENEAEFRAYNIISHIRDQDVARQTMTLPMYIFKSSHITRALEFRALSQRNNEIMESSSRRNKPGNVEASQNFYSAYFKLIADPGTSFLMACMLETHFPDVRKGALKAMNIAYMIKAGGVQAEDVRQVLAYDSVKQLLEEAQLYGLIIDNSLGVPTIRFGQKHYKNKIAVFVEPLSNPAQRKSLLLVEPKKAGRNFRDIINGINPNVVPLPNQNVFAPQSNPIDTAGTFSFNAQAQPFTPKAPITVNVTLSEITSDQDIISKIEKNDVAKSKAAAAEALAARERKKLEELLEKKKLQVAEKEQATRLEEERLNREKELQEQLEKQKEREQAELEQMQQALIRKQRNEQIAVMHLNVVKSQVSKRILDDVLETIVKEQAQNSICKAIKSKRLLKKIAKPWLARARSAIAKRTDYVMSRKRKWQLNMYLVTHNPYVENKDSIYKSTPVHATPKGIKERVNHSIQAEKIVLENPNLTKDPKVVWKTEEFALNIYPRIRDKMLDLKKALSDQGDSEKPGWQLIINTSNDSADSSVWFKRKFGLENTLRKDNLYQAFDITTRLITPQTTISCQLAIELGAVIFSLPESKAEKNEAETAQYWEDNKSRLNEFVEKIQKYNPGMKVPFLFTYFPDSSSTELMLKKIPLLLGLDSNHLVSDYHILVMNPATISSRIVQEVNWLSNNTIINY